MLTYPDAEIGAQNLRTNRIELWQQLNPEPVPPEAQEPMTSKETEHTPPATGHYPDIFYWDLVFSAMISAQAARNGGPEAEHWTNAAISDMQAVVNGIEPDGFLPNVRFVERGRRFDPERILALGRSATTTNYTQPPVLAMGTRAIFLAAQERDETQAEQFLSAVYPKLQDHYRYFGQIMVNGPDDPLIGITHPHATGRDSDPTFDTIKPHRLPRRGVDTHQFVDKLNTGLDYADILLHGIRLRSTTGNIAKQREIYWVNDVMMNCIYADNLYEAAELAAIQGDVATAEAFTLSASNVERQILDKLWFPDARGRKGAFYALDKNSEPIEEMTVSNLFPLVLATISEQQLESVFDLMDEGFNVPFPLPSVATFSPNFDPHNREAERLWRGPTWINTNWYIAERGLWRQVLREDLTDRPDLIARSITWALRIGRSSRALVDMSGLHEHFNPLDGSGQRAHVKRFAWSNLAYISRIIFDTTPVFANQTAAAAVRG